MLLFYIKYYIYIYHYIILEMISTDDGWKIVFPKEKKTKKNSNKKTTSLSFDDTTRIITKCLIGYSPEAIFMYGSRARRTNRPDSDVDIMVFWKVSVIPNYDTLCEIKEDLMEKLGLNIDFVVMKLKSKFVEVHDLRTICYYDNVKVDAKCLYSKKNTHLAELIDFSEKQEKV